MILFNLKDHITFNFMVEYKKKLVWHNNEKRKLSLIWKYFFCMALLTTNGQLAKKNNLFYLNLLFIFTQILILINIYLSSQKNYIYFLGIILFTFIKRYKYWLSIKGTMPSRGWVLIMWATFCPNGGNHRFI